MLAISHWAMINTRTVALNLCVRCSTWGLHRFHALLTKKSITKLFQQYRVLYGLHLDFSAPTFQVQYGIVAEFDLIQFDQVNTRLSSLLRFFLLAELKRFVNKLPGTALRAEYTDPPTRPSRPVLSATRVPPSQWFPRLLPASSLRSSEHGPRGSLCS